MIFRLVCDLAKLATRRASNIGPLLVIHLAWRTRRNFMSENSPNLGIYLSSQLTRVRCHHYCHATVFITASATDHMLGQIGYTYARDQLQWAHVHITQSRIRCRLISCWTSFYVSRLAPLRCIVHSYGTQSFDVHREIWDIVAQVSTDLYHKQLCSLHWSLCFQVSRVIFNDCREMMRDSMVENYEGPQPPSMFGRTTTSRKLSNKWKSNDIT